MIKLKDVVEQEAPGMMHSSNHVSEGDTLGFDYLKGCREFVDYPGVGFTRISIRRMKIHLYMH